MSIRAALRQFLVDRLGPIIEPRFHAYKAPLMIQGYGSSRRTRYSDTAYFYHRDRISIADNVFIWHFSILDGTGGIEIGEGVQIGAGCYILTHSSHVSIRLYGRHYRDVAEEDKIGYKVAPVSIGKYSFLSAGVQMLPGSSLGIGCLALPGAVITKVFPDFSIVGGNPARRTGDSRDYDREHLEAHPELRGFYEEWAGMAIGAAIVGSGRGE